MAKRAVIGLVKGLLVGGLFALVLVKLLGVATFGALLAYPLAIVIGLIAGLVAGKPIWARDGRIEAALKAVVGAVVGGGLMFALRKWINPTLDLGTFGAGGLGSLPVVTLPVIAALLSIFFELDNTGETAEAAAKPRIATDKSRVELDAIDSELESEDVSASARSRKHEG